MKMTALDRAEVSLMGLSVGDAFGERFFVNPAVVESMIASRAVPSGTWKWTDDTAMAVSIVQVLHAAGHVDATLLAQRFAAAYREDPRRGYGGGAHQILSELGQGIPYKIAAGSVFDGSGSYGNGGAMRSAPIGAYFYDDLPAVVRNAKASADPTHTHLEGYSGAIAIAVAAAEAQRQAGGDRDPERLMDMVIEHTPTSETRQNVQAARTLLGTGFSVAEAVDRLGNGSKISSQDTVGFSVLMAAEHLDDYENAMWATVAGLGDRDTTCAIVGGIIACFVGEEGIPLLWRHSREALPSIAT